MDDTTPITEWRLARAQYDAREGVTPAAVARLVRALRRHRLAEAVLEQRARYLLEWAKRVSRTAAFAAVSERDVTPPSALPLFVTAQTGPLAGPHILTRDEIAALLDQPLANGVRIRHARRADLLAHAETLERQAGAMLRHARIVRALATWLGDEAETVEAALARQAVA
jgi:hypothetical protein